MCRSSPFAVWCSSSAVLFFKNSFLRARSLRIACARKGSFACSVLQVRPWLLACVRVLCSLHLNFFHSGPKTHVYPSARRRLLFHVSLPARKKNEHAFLEPPTLPKYQGVDVHSWKRVLHVGAFAVCLIFSGVSTRVKSSAGLMTACFLDS